MTPNSKRLPGMRASRGLSIVELMVGIAIGLFILAGATMLMTSQLGDNRRMLLETQLQQDLRVAADMISRDVRRAGYWSNAVTSVWADTTSAAIVQPFATLKPAPDGDAKTVQKFEYLRSIKDEVATGAQPNAVLAAEHLGFQLKDGVIQYQISEGNWQALTDPNVMTVTKFDMTVKSSDLPVPCGASCPTGVAGCKLNISIRDVSLTIEANAVHDTTVTRSLADYIRLRNDVPVCKP